jgi:hypothetical protein
MPDPGPGDYGADTYGTGLYGEGNTLILPTLIAGVEADQGRGADPEIFATPSSW